MCSVITIPCKASSWKIPCSPTMLPRTGCLCSSRGGSGRINRSSSFETISKHTFLSWGSGIEKELVGGVFGGSAAEERLMFASKFVEGRFRVVKTRSGAEDDYDNND